MTLFPKSDGVPSYLFARHQVAHALCGCLSDMIMVFKHVLLNLRESLLFQDLHPSATEDGKKELMNQATISSPPLKMVWQQQ